MSTKSTGRCLCGTVRFEVKGDPLWVAHCHCESCRRHTGCAVTTFVGFCKSALSYTHGTPGVYESSPGVRRRHCVHCGTPLSYEADRCDDEVHLYISTLDDPARFPAQSHVFFAERIAWFDVHDALPRYVGFGTGKPPVSIGPAGP